METPCSTISLRVNRKCVNTASADTVKPVCSCVFMVTSGRVTFPGQEHAEQSSHGDCTKSGQKLWRGIFQVIEHIWYPQKQIYKFKIMYIHKSLPFLFDT